MTISPPKSAFTYAAKYKKPKSKRPAPFSIRFSDEERAELNSKRGVLSLAAYIRLRLFTDEAEQPAKRKKLTRKHYKPSVEVAVLSQMLGALGESRLPSNLNQIAKAANLGALPVTPELEQELFEACAHIKAMRHDLIGAIGVKDHSAA